MQSNVNGFGNVDNQGIGAFTVFNEELYAATLNHLGGAEIWRTDGITWTAVITGGFGITGNLRITSLTVFNDQIYALTRNLVSGSELWRSNDGIEWENVFTGGLGNPQNCRGYGLITFNQQLYYFTGNWDTGGEVWRSTDGSSWEQIGFGGWGNPDNVGPLFDNSIEIFNERLFAGTAKVVTPSTGGEIWMYNPLRAYMPLIIHATEYYAP